MTDKNTISNYLKILINGILMGTANKIPGVSGGLVAIAIGFYEELIFSLKRFDKTALKFLIKAKFNDFFKVTLIKIHYCLSLNIDFQHLKTLIHKDFQTFVSFQLVKYSHQSNYLKF